MPKGPKKPTYDDLLHLLKYAVSRIGGHNDNCRNRGSLRFVECHCWNAVSIRNIEKVIKRADPDYYSEADDLKRINERAAQREARWAALAAERKAAAEKKEE